MGGPALNVASQELWGRMAAGWHGQREYLWETSKPVGEWLVQNLRLRPGQTVLELAAGMGDCGFVAARVLGDRGRLISTDFAPSMVEGARRRAAELGIDNAEFRVVDAQRMDLEDDSVDGVICRWGFMLMDDPLAAFREARRVLRPGGRLCLSVFSTADRNPWAAIPARALIAEKLMAPPPPDRPGILALSDTGRLRQLLRDAGFSDVTVDQLPITWRYASYRAYWEFLLEVAGAISTLIESLDEDQRSIAREAIERGVADFRSGEQVVLPGVTLNAAAS